MSNKKLLRYGRFFRPEGLKKESGWDIYYSLKTRGSPAKYYEIYVGMDEQEAEQKMKEILDKWHY